MFLAVLNTEVQKFGLDRSDAFFAKFRLERMRRHSKFSLWFKSRTGVRIILILSIFFLLISIVLARNNSHNQLIFSYSEADTYVDFLLNEDMDGMIASYVLIENFYANVRSYIDSRSEYHGGPDKAVNLINEVDQIRNRTTFPEISNALPEDSFIPSGYKSATFFNDEFNIVDTNGTVIKTHSHFLMDQHSLVLYMKLLPQNAWIQALDTPILQHWYKNPLINRKIVPISVLDTRFLPKGQYRLNIKKNLWPAADFGAKKHFVIVSLKNLGSFNGLATLICVLMSLILFLIYILFQLMINKHIFVVRFTPEECSYIRTMWLKKLVK